MIYKVNKDELIEFCTRAKDLFCQNQTENSDAYMICYSSNSLHIFWLTLSTSNYDSIHSRNLMQGMDSNSVADDFTSIVIDSIRPLLDLYDAHHQQPEMLENVVLSIAANECSIHINQEKYLFEPVFS
ncbi:hypothetical protein K08M3_51190 [Vibrio alginolyticus]|uniref:Uncharacterized protein n=1 Tax=Vibrio alginolyticus TaxID=663 RepID=A0A1W6UVC4_VIBAL|nr:MULTISPECIES: hypothetical protein [Vibrio harveyi group]ARP06629.1 hypothetical protein K04M1_51060 [Vibrio alginolyticus]ARP11762.1 hypothetical protein K04M3_51930 [Vibrio alginolyticus]ARP16815.1 hypothetical protein K04M5_51630 [Vibrio alginolyticus]ARP21852.1 hypothetical protein K05K4_51500 [Vibrio alginolyticus]ARP26940.1 hypothetical protein K06K5_51400 [Vibrio alginolyticus]